MEEEKQQNQKESEKLFSEQALEDNLDLEAEVDELPL